MVSIHPLRLATVTIPTENRVAELPHPLPVYAFLVQDGATNILVDTGIGANNAYINKHYLPKIYPIEAALAAHQLGVTDIDTVVNSHLHFDHCGNNSSFRHADIIVHRSELAAAQEDRYTVSEWVNFPGAKYLAVDAKTRITDKVQVVPSIGHTAGHLSVEIQHEDGQLDLIVAQAAYSCKEFSDFPTTRQVTQPGMWNVSKATEALESLSSKVIRHAYFSHDPLRFVGNPQVPNAAS